MHREHLAADNGPGDTHMTDQISEAALTDEQRERLRQALVHESLLGRIEDPGVRSMGEDYATTNLPIILRAIQRADLRLEDEPKSAVVWV